MATNENVNKVIYGNQTVMDITDTTAEESDVASGEVFYKANGARSVGTLDVDSAVWGQITGDINDQSDLMNELGKKVIKLTQAQYNALSSAEKHDTDKVYYIYDYSPAPITLINDAIISLTSTWSSQKINQEITNNKYTLPTASSTTKGGVKVGSGLDISNDSLYLKQFVHTQNTFSVTSTTIDAKKVGWIRVYLTSSEQRNQIINNGYVEGATVGDGQLLTVVRDIAYNQGTYGAVDVSVYNTYDTNKTVSSVTISYAYRT